MATKFITVSIEIMHDKNLTTTEKFILAEIQQLEQLDKGCIASNQHFADLIGIERPNASRVITSLKNKGYITAEVVKGSRNMERIIRSIKMITPSIKTSSGCYQNDNEVVSKRQETKENKQLINNKESVEDTSAPSSDSKKSKVMFTDVDMALALTMYNNLKAMHDGFKKPNLDKWANEFRLMRTIDKRKPEGMDNFLHSLATENGMWEFWRGNILSPASMRKNYDKVISQYRKDVVQTKKVVDTSVPLDQRIKMLSERKAI